MKVMCISDNVKKLKELKRLCQESQIFDEVNAFFSEYDVAEYLKANIVNMVLLDAEMGDGRGIEAIPILRGYQNHINVVVFSERKEVAFDAYQFHASGCLLWPVTMEQIMEEAEYLRFTLPKDKKRIFAKTFGNFELYVDGRPVLFKNGKTKELFAYLLDRGTMCGNQEIIARLWADDEDHNSYLKKLRVDMIETLHYLECDDLIIKSRGEIGVNRNNLSSDLMEWENRTEEGKGAFCGEYMSQFSWAESRLSYMLGANS